MGVLDRLAHFDDELEPRVRRQLILVTISVDGNATHQFHHKVESAPPGAARIVYLHDIGMIHHGERLPLRFEAGDHLRRVHAPLD
jgi:hypothetical protein